MRPAAGIVCGCGKHAMYAVPDAEWSPEYSVGDERMTIIDKRTGYYFITYGGLPDGGSMVPDRFRVHLDRPGGVLPGGRTEDEVRELFKLAREVDIITYEFPFTRPERCQWAKEALGWSTARYKFPPLPGPAGSAPETAASKE